MKTRDLSPALIGKTIRVEKPGIVGTHNYIEGTLENFEFDTERIHGAGRHPVRVYPIGLSAEIAGLSFDLNGREPLTVLSDNGDPSPVTALERIQNYLNGAGND